MNKKSILIVLLSVLLSAGAALLVSEIVVSHRLSKATTARGERIVSGSTEPQRVVPAANLASFSDAAEAAVQTVVYVKVVKRAKVARPSSIFDMLFGFAEIPQEQVGLGSGVIIRPDGYIVTNNHVINGADAIEVTLENDKVYTATLVGTDPATDIALLKIDAEDLPCIAMGDSDQLRLGDWVLAIGSPYDLRSTITAGIVSAKGRSLPNYDGQFRVESFIQTDAAVNPGNSGGALVNTAGELVGINTSIISLTGSYAGYSFAVPVNIVKKIADDFINYGSVQRAMLGVSMSEINAERARKLGLMEVSGVYVEAVQKDGPADRAGIRVGDILTEINLNVVRNGAAVQEQMSKLRPGEQAVVTLLRGGERKEIIVAL